MSATAVTPKQEVTDLLSKLPDSTTLEDIHYHLYVLQKLKRAQADIAVGNGVTQEQARERLGKWLKA